MLTGVRRARGWSRSHPLLADAVLAAALLGAAAASAHVTIGIFDDDPTFERPDAAGVGVLLAAMTLPLALRRRFPLAVLAVSTAAFVALGLELGPRLEATFTAIVLALAFYSAAAHGRTPPRDAVCGLCVAAVTALSVHELHEIGGSLPVLYYVFTAVGSAALLIAMWALGAALATGRRRAGELLERTVELERERGENARRAVFEERVRIARELHDVVAHHVSMMGVQAGAARLVLQRDRTKAEQALAAIETSSRQAVLELHRLLGFLRQAGDRDESTVQPGLGEVPRLAATLRESDLAVGVRVDGEPRPLPPTVEVSAYRIVQEALTNTLKHAGASRAEVHLRYGRDQLGIEVVDDGRGRAAPAAGAGGLGLIGMRERVALHGGSFSAGPAAGGGYAVRVELPTPDGAL